MPHRLAGLVLALLLLAACAPSDRPAVNRQRPTPVPYAYSTPTYARTTPTPSAPCATAPNHSRQCHELR